MPDNTRSLTLLVHGDTKVGKSTLAITAPYPRLMLDVEGGNRFLPILRKVWDPKTEPPPVADGTWDTCVVYTRDYDTMNRVYQWLAQGSHQFRSVIIDSISELQIKCLESIAGRGQVKTDQWGELLRSFTGLMRDMRDLTMHPTNPLEAVVLTAMSRDLNGKRYPYLQGQSAVQIPYLFDVVGAMVVETFAHPDPTQPPYSVRRMYVAKHDLYEAGERVQGRLGSIVEQADLNVERMLEIIFGPRAEPAAAAEAPPPQEQAPPAEPAA